MSTRNVEEELAQGVRFGYRPEFDGLRGVAILSVVFLHYFQSWSHAGILGVDLFFVLSGFLLTRLMLEERQQFGTISRRNFYVKRAARLGPGMLVLVVPSVVGALLLLGEQRTSLLWGSLASITFTNNWFMVAGVDIGGLSHLWSIASEEQFYLLWPLIVIGVGGRIGRIRNVTALVGIAAAANIVIRSAFGVHFDVLYHGLDARAGLMLMAGCWLATMVTVSGMTWLNKRVLSAVLVLTLAVRVYFTIILGEDDYTVVWRYGGIQLTALSMIVVIVATMELPWLKALLSARVLQWLGRLAYGIFLWHRPIETFTDSEFVEARWLRNLVYFALTLVVAYLSNRFIEQPARAYIIRRYGDPARRPSKVAVPS